MAAIGFSKSKFVRGVQCPKMLWLEANMPDEAERTENQQILDTGNEVGDLAMGLFGEFTEVPYDSKNYPGMMELTQKLLAQNTATVCEAAFSHDGCFCAVDILRNLGNNKVEIYEVKSSAHVKDYHITDISYQNWVLTQLGYSVEKVSLVHINSQYVRIGDLDIQQLFTIEDVTEEAKENYDSVGKAIADLRTYLEQAEEPACPPGGQCYAPFECAFCSYCSRYAPPAPEGHTLDDIAGMQERSKEKYRSQGLITFEQLLAAGVLTGKAYQQVAVEVQDLPPQIDKAAVSAFLNTLSYPLYFLDFEGYAPAIPPYNYTQPFHQIPFQYSLHYIEYKGGPLLHKEYLARPSYDPRRQLAEQLCADIPMNVCVTAYHKDYECGRLNELAALFPDLQEHLSNISGHVADLETPFKKRWYYTRQMYGKSSIKKVLPALYPDDPELDYHNLEGVHHGMEASETYLAMATMGPEEVETWRGHLLKYCGLDTLAMVKVWEKLQQAVE